MHTPVPLDRAAWQGELEDLLSANVSLALLTSATNPVLGWEIARDRRSICSCAHELTGRVSGPRIVDIINTRPCNSRFTKLHYPAR
ncbi:MAG: hypothetical protein RMJ54_07295 [Roseiflexaceae bacterium]|nr:hypothetical protein [Roseiflexaceae bacterium]